MFTVAESTETAYLLDGRYKLQKTILPDIGHLQIAKIEDVAARVAKRYTKRFDGDDTLDDWSAEPEERVAAALGQLAYLNIVAMLETPEVGGVLKSMAFKQQGFLDQSGRIIIDISTEPLFREGAPFLEHPVQSLLREQGRIMEQGITAAMGELSQMLG